MMLSELPSSGNLPENKEGSPPPLPPKLPPVLGTEYLSPPPALPPAVDSLQVAALKGRLHPATLAVGVFGILKSFLIPIVLLLFLGRDSTMGMVFAGFLGLNLVGVLVRYFTFSYRIENGELITRGGLLERRERHIPLERVQDIRIEQGILHRLLRVVDAHVETAGGKGAEAVLSVLSVSEAENLQRVVSEQMVQIRAKQGRTVETTHAINPEDQGDIVRQLGWKDLILAGLTSNRSASALAIIFGSLSLFDDFLPKETGERVSRWIASRLEIWFNGGGDLTVLKILLAALVVILISSTLSAIGSLILFHGFTLRKKGEDLRRQYGLFTRRRSLLPRRRIQVLEIEQGMVRRWFKLASVRVDTAGGGASTPEEAQERQGRDVLLPIAREKEIPDLLPSFLPQWEGLPEKWSPISRKAIRRGLAKITIISLLISGAALYFHRQWWDAWPLILIPLYFWNNLQNYKHLGYYLGQYFFMTRRGWLGRSTHIVPLRNAQTILVSQTPFDRRLKLRTVLVDTAGQTHTGGGPQVKNLPEDEAYLLAWKLARKAAQLRYRWK